jgi:hypothetical protein
VVRQSLFGRLCVVAEAPARLPGERSLRLPLSVRQVRLGWLAWPPDDPWSQLYDLDEILDMLGVGTTQAHLQALLEARDG